MAQKVEVLLVDDLDGGEADETVTFGLDGSTYEVDLSSDNAAKLRESLGSFIEAGRKKARKAAKGKAKTSRSSSNQQRAAEIRAWAKESGLEVNERGRIPQSVVDKYEAAQKG
ncbi:histone-like nucleoid-structuring protein Lsr2 [Nocardiopsis salina]|uniref:histone-like nucleoid-structuring protein Lsr2 n=1 Tax=Nocardiopsis salina TaxID=245836 RepID=UPI00034C96FD|nr:Lsr2 family protein [Nocardiopsis salina]